MTTRVQVILQEEEASRFKAQARKESKSLSAWLRSAGKKAMELSRNERKLTDAASLKKFFKECNEDERGKEPDWGVQKDLILQGYRTQKTT